MGGVPQWHDLFSHVQSCTFHEYRYSQDIICNEFLVYKNNGGGKTKPTTRLKDQFRRLY